MKIATETKLIELSSIMTAKYLILDFEQLILSTNLIRRVIYNFSSRHLSEDETEALSHGLKFGLPPTKLNYRKYFLPFEKLFGNLKEEPIYCNSSGDGRKRVRSTVQHLAFESFFTYSHPENEVYSNIYKFLEIPK